MRTKLRLSIIALVMTGSLAPAFAQDSRQISLDEAIQLSLKNSKQLKLSAAQVKESKAGLREARERRLPDLSVTGSYMWLTQPKLDLKVKLGNSGGDGGSSGGSTGSSIPKIDQAMYGIANLSVPLFAGFKIQNGINAAKYLAHAAELDAENDREEIIANTIAAYCNLFKAKEALAIVKQNLLEAEHRVADFTNMEKNGLIPRNDLLKAQLQKSNVELALLDAENNWKITYINMNLMLGLPEETELVPDTNSFKMTADMRTFEEWEAVALENRKDAKAYEYRVKAANAGVRAARGDYYPSLALTGGYIAADIPKLLTITNVVNGGVGLKYSPSSLWKTGAKVAEAKAKVQQAEAGMELMNDGIRLQIAKAYQNYLSANKKIEVYTKAKEQAEENYRIVKNKHTNSLATTAELLDADLAKLQAELNHAFAQADAYVAYKTLQQNAGTINN